MLAIVAVVLQCLGRIFFALLVLSLISGFLGIPSGESAVISVALIVCICIAVFTVKTKLPIYRGLNRHQANRLLAICIFSAVGWFFFFSKANSLF